MNGNFTDIAGFNRGPRRERPALRFFVAGGLVGAVAIAWLVAAQDLIAMGVGR